MDRRPTLVTFLLIAVAFLLPLYHLFLPYALALIMGGIVAVLVQPLQDRLVRRRVPPGIAAAVLTIAAIALVVAPIVLLVAAALRQSSAAIASVAADPAGFVDAIADWLFRWTPVTRFVGDREDFRVQFREFVGSSAALLSSFLLRQLAAVPQVLLQLSLGALATFFFLLDGRRLFAWITGKLPLPLAIRVALGSAFRFGSVAVVLASMAAACAQALIALVTFYALGIPGAALAGGASFIASWIPLVGVGPVWLAGGIYLYVEGETARLVVLIVLGVIGGLVDNVVRPLVLRGRRQIHPLLTLVAIFGGLQMFGVLGVFVGPLLAGMGVAVLEIWPAVAAFCGIAVPEMGEDGLTDVSLEEAASDEAPDDTRPA